MASETTNYKFTKPAETDYYDVQVQNENWEKADQELQSLEESKVTGDGGSISDTETAVVEPTDATKYPELQASGGTTKTIFGKLARWVKSLKADKVDVSGGDIKDTKVSEFTASTAQWPVPTAGEEPKTLWGKVKKFFEDFKTWSAGVCLLAQLVSNTTTNNSNLPASAAAVYQLAQAMLGYAPKSHASTDTTYGKGDASHFGHVELSDNYTSSAGAAANGVAASSKALADAYSVLNTKTNQIDSNLNNYTVREISSISEPSFSGVLRTRGKRAFLHMTFTIPEGYDELYSTLNLCTIPADLKPNSDFISMSANGSSLMAFIVYAMDGKVAYRPYIIPSQVGTVIFREVCWDVK